MSQTSLKDMLLKCSTLSSYDTDISDEELERSYNRRERKTPREGIECPICGNHEYTWVVRDGERFYHTCECKACRDNLRNIRTSGLAEQLERCTFESFETLEPWQKTAKGCVQKFTQDERRGWLLLSGQPGCGKTHLCTAAAGKFLEAGFSTKYMRWTEESVLLKACISNDMEYERRLRPFKSCQVLYVDDFWKTKRGAEPTPADVKLAFDLLDFRYCNRKLITLISTEWTVNQMLDIDDALGSRIYEMTKNGYRLAFSGANKNWRIAHCG